MFTESNRYTVGGEFMRIVKLLITILAKKNKVFSSWSYLTHRMNAAYTDGRDTNLNMTAV